MSSRTSSIAILAALLPPLFLGGTVSGTGLPGAAETDATRSGARATAFAPVPTASLPAVEAPRIAETRSYSLVQTVTLHGVEADAERVRVWVPVPGDTAWQRVLDRRVVGAPDGWKLVRQPDARGDLVYIETDGSAAVDGKISVVVELTVERDSPQVDLSTGTASSNGADPFQAGLFAEYLRHDATNMTVTPQVRAMAEHACAGESDPRRKVIRLVHAVGEVADHYSKDPSKPHCGRGSAEDCLEHGGGCCTDLHSLFVAMARSQGIPTRIQFGYRLNPAREGVEYDPSYRCWIETWLPGSGWVATDVVVADGGSSADRDAHIGHLDANRVWLWEGRGFDLSPRQSGGPIHTMLAGWAEIDGVTADPLPAADGTPPALRRTIRFDRIAD